MVEVTDPDPKKYVEGGYVEEGYFLDPPVSATEGSSTVVVDSSAWTGLPSNFVLDEARTAELSALLIRAENDLNSLGASNSEKAMARAYIVAARALAEAPEPPVDIIWEIIGRANNLAGIASLFVSIVALFQTAMH